MKNYLLVLFFSFAFTCALQAQVKKSPSFGKGLVNYVADDSTFSVKFGARVQSLFFAGWNLNDPTGYKDFNSNFLIRRTRLKFDGFAYTPKLKYKFEFGFSNRDFAGGGEETREGPRMILDGVLKWNFAGNFVLWGGQTKLPGNRERVVSSANLQLVDRSQLNSKFNLDRDIGFQLRHHHTVGDNFIIREIAAWSQGEGRNVTVGNIGGYQYTGRVELLPMGKFAGKGDYVSSDLKRESTPKLAIGITYDQNNGASRTRGNTGSFIEFGDSGDYSEETLKTFFVDAMFKYNGWSFMGEYADRDAEDPYARDSNGNANGAYYYVGKGLNLQLGYLFRNNWEIAGRFTDIKPDNRIDFNSVASEVTFKEYTLGLSKYVVGHKLKMQTDVVYRDNANIPIDNLWYRFQFEIHL